jgi:hypothetical protein
MCTPQGDVKCIPEIQTYSEFVGFYSWLPEPKDKCNFACDNRLSRKSSYHIFIQKMSLALLSFKTYKFKYRIVRGIQIFT